MDRLRCNLGGRIPSCSQYWKCYNSSYDGTDLDDSWVVASKYHFCCKTVSLVLVVTANRTVNVLVLWGVEIKKIRNFDETWMTVPLWYKTIKSGRKTATINTKTLEVLSLLRPTVHDTFKTAKITWFILVLHWAVDVIKVIYYIHGPVDTRINQVIFAVLNVSWTVGLNSDKTSKVFLY